MHDNLRTLLQFQSQQQQKKRARKAVSEVSRENSVTRQNNLKMLDKIIANTLSNFISHQIKFSRPL